MTLAGRFAEDRRLFSEPVAMTTDLAAPVEAVALNDGEANCRRKAGADGVAQHADIGRGSGPGRPVDPPSACRLVAIAIDSRIVERRRPEEPFSIRITSPPPAAAWRAADMPAARPDHRYIANRY